MLLLSHILTDSLEVHSYYIEGLKEISWRIFKDVNELAEIIAGVKLELLRVCLVISDGEIGIIR